MAETGLGVDGYIQYQRESTWGTDIVSSMTLIPVKNSSLISVNVENIENENIISSRLKQDPNPGRQLVGGELGMDIPPTLIADLMTTFLGAPSTAGPTDSTYTHTWLAPTSGERIASSLTLQQAIGGDLADQFSGAMITGITIEGEAGGNILITFKVIAKDYTEDVARISSFSYPSTIPYSFSMGVLNIDPSGVSNFDQDMNSFTLEIDLGYDTERFKIGDATTKQPVFQTIPTATFSCNIDAHQQFIDYARAHTSIDLTLTLTHTVVAAGSTVFSTVIEIPGARITPETSIENGSARLSMDLEFTCGYGGTTTGSSGSNVMFEVAIVDATSSYSA